MNSSKIFIISRGFSGLFFQIQTLAHFPKFWISRHAFGPSKARKVRHYFRREKSDLENKYLISLCERFRMTFKVSDKLQIQFINFSNYEMKYKKYLLRMNLFIIGKLKWTTDDNLHVRETELDYLELPVNTILHHSLKPHLHALKKSARHAKFLAPCWRF